jgi:protein-disulfide isomerase
MTTHAQAHLALPANERDHSRGPAEAPITLVEYGDFECPFCGMAYPAVKDVQRRLGNRLRYVYRHFPRTQEHPHAHLAAEAAEAAAAQGRFWEMHDLLFEHQRALEPDDLVSYAAQLGLDTDRFRRELETHAYHDRVRRDVRSALRSGVHGTPTFFINGARHEGRWESEELLGAIERVVSAQPPADMIPPPDVAADEVAEASWESFPASDAPAWRDHERASSGPAGARRGVEAADGSERGGIAGGG